MKARTGRYYRHRKGGIYFVELVAKHSETGEELVVYREAAPGPGGLRIYHGPAWARPRTMFEDGRFEELEHAPVEVPG